MLFRGRIYTVAFGGGAERGARRTARACTRFHDCLEDTLGIPSAADAVVAEQARPALGALHAEAAASNAGIPAQTMRTA
jgi:hypothetical protein